MVNRMYPVDTIVRDLVRASGETGKPLMVSWVASAPEGEQAMTAAGLAVFTDATRCLKALAALVRSARPARPLAAPPAVPALGGEAAEILAASEAGPLDEHAKQGCPGRVRRAHRGRAARRHG
jgi:acyl-CoA synthetase (NDP forming)